MFPTLPFGPLSLPTGPVLAILSFWIGLELAARYGRRLGLHPDRVWNAGLVALLAGLIVARLWTVVQFRYIYLAEPQLIFSLRPSGYALLPGVIAALLAAYGWMVYKALDPVRMLAAFSVGFIGAAAVQSVSGFLSGGIVGAPTDVPWAAVYFDSRVHAVGLYRAGALLWLLLLLWRYSDPARPLRTVYLAGFGYCVVRLFTDAFLAEPRLWGTLRAEQVMALVGAVVFAWLLAREKPIINGEQEMVNG